MFSKSTWLTGIGLFGNRDIVGFVGIGVDSRSCSMQSLHIGFRYRWWVYSLCWTLGPTRDKVYVSYYATISPETQEKTILTIKEIIWRTKERDSTEIDDKNLEHVWLNWFRVLRASQNAGLTSTGQDRPSILEHFLSSLEVIEYSSLMQLEWCQEDGERDLQFFTSPVLANGWHLPLRKFAKVLDEIMISWTPRPKPKNRPHIGLLGSGYLRHPTQN